MNNPDPSFKNHMMYSAVWLIIGFCAVWLIGETATCNLDANPLCEEQKQKVMFESYLIMMGVLSFMIVLRIIAHHFKMKGVVKTE